MKKLSTIVTIVVLAATLICILPSISSEDTEAATDTQNGLVYKLNDKGSDEKNTAEVGKIISAQLPEELTIPEYIESQGKKFHVVSINTTFPTDNTTLKKVTIEGNPGIILKTRLFANTNIEAVTIGEGVDLPNGAFNGCKKLTNVVLPQSLTTLPAGGVFSGCSSLSSITIGNQITTIGASAFANCTSLVDFKIPESVTSIGNYAFNNCTGLKEVYIGPNVSSIGMKAFNGIDQTLIKFYSTSLEIGKTCFFDEFSAISIPQDNTAYTTDNGVVYNKDKTILVYFPRTITTTDGEYTTSASIGPYAFYNTKLTKITITDGAKSIGKYAFANCYNLSEVTIADSVTEIGEGAFESTSSESYSSSLTKIILPSSIEEIPTNAFTFCTKLTDITIPEKVTKIGKSAFSNCAKLQNVNILGNVESIGEHAFSPCISLSKINLPDSVTSIGNYAFMWGSTASMSLFTLNKLPTNLETVGNYAFYGCSLKITELPKNLTSIGAYAFYNTAIENITVGESKLITIGSETTTTLHTFGGPMLRSIQLNNVTVGNMQFRGTIVDNLSSLESYTLGPEFKLWNWDENGIGLNTENKTAYLIRNDVTKFTIPTAVEKLEGTGFQNSYMSSIDFEGESSRNITIDIGTGVTAFYKGMFKGCANLENVRLPDVTFTDANTFKDCGKIKTIEIYKTNSFDANNIPKLVIHNYSKSKNLINTYYIQFPDNLTSVSGTANLYDETGSSIAYKPANISKLVGQTFVWNGTYTKTQTNLALLTSDQKVVCLDYGDSAAFVAVDKNTQFDPYKIAHKSYEVDKWYTDKGLTIEYTPSDTSIPTTLFAKLVPKIYTVTKTGNEPFVMTYNGNVVEDSVQVHSGDTVIITAKKEGFVCTAKVNDKRNGELSGTQSSLEIEINQNSDISIAYKAITVNMTFVIPGSDNIVVTGVSGEPFEKPSDPVKPGYTFVGWIPQLTDNITPLMTSTITTEAREYTAYWRPNSVQISFDTSEGNSLAPIFRYYDTTYGDLPVPEKTGYTFDGWYAANSKKVLYENVVRSDEPIQLKARWCVNQYTVTFDTGNGKEPIVVTQDYGTSFTAPANPVKEDFIFLKWLPECPATIPAENITINAVWAPIISPDHDGKITITLTDGDTFVIASDETKEVTVMMGKNRSVSVSSASDLSGKMIISSINAIENTSDISGTAYDLTFTSEGTPYNGNMTITLPYIGESGKNATVYYWDGSETSKMPIVKSDMNSVTFTTNHNSIYIVASEDIPKDDDDNGMAAIAIVIAVIIAVLVTVVYIKKKA